MNYTFSVKNLVLASAALLMFSPGAIFAQSKKMYIATRSGLNLREAPEATAKRLLTIPYGTQIEIEPTDQKIALEGLEGNWIKTSFKGKTGYAADLYLVSLPLPGPKVKTFWDYLEQLAPGAEPKKNNRERLETEFGITQSDGEGAGCMDGRRIIFSRHSLPEVFAITRLIYLKQFPALKKPFAELQNKPASARDRNPAGEKGTTEISVFQNDATVHFTSTFKYNPCKE